MNLKDKIPSLLEAIAHLSLTEALSFIAQSFPGKVAFSTALGQEDQVITHAIFTNNIPVRIFSLDTGRLFPETYELWAETEQKYRNKIVPYYPKAEAVEELVSRNGINGFYDSVENRKACCHVRKVQPLGRALHNVDVWVTGLRSGQSANRSSFNLLEWDEAFQVIKFNPIINWSFDEMLAYLKENEVPYNKLHDQGFVSIGCAPCTRAIAPGEEPRAGRWWWEQTQKECGLHANYFNK
ncbi:phosphoadenylyl-sulfate reductase [Pontibacter sp. BT310]|uniref:Adenosine 5'-phosphosulfate reductase n=1 Tax=Pontibacter populi TaxID=890055 RepID=A0ABS6XAM9_9BACT|nr:MULTISPECIES: phosphoadenylyl-sulfate reductase [Pontibacter]MBJ6118197.1 phosphoadenylyl-sulfate reductase [Pontibacter sp. BT310]MBR0570624.1 phosphoadenylyl-sulfate reductase [Microvirga sp. STS03]MBW3365050.1 phosphoadenylyl-sulfate reductase [Pontibacter populi]